MNREKFFEKSQVRDSAGDLLPVYHGTSAGEFSIFIQDLNEDGDDQYGGGTYFSSSYDTALGYTGDGTGRVMECYLNIAHPLIVDGTQHANLRHVDISGEEAARILLHHSGLYLPVDEEDTPEYNPMVDYLASVVDRPPHTRAEFQGYIRKMAASYFDPTNMLLLDVFFGRRRGSEFRRAVYDVCGYDGIRVDFQTSSTFVAWFPEQIKLTSNANPTNSKDIRK